MYIYRARERESGMSNKMFIMYTDIQVIQSIYIEYIYMKARGLDKPDKATFGWQKGLVC